MPEAIPTPGEVIGVLLLGVFLGLVFIVVFSNGAENYPATTAAALIPATALLLILVIFISTFMGRDVV